MRFITQQLADSPGIEPGINAVFMAWKTPKGSADASCEINHEYRWKEALETTFYSAGGT
jgi:hypothetical protein